MSSYRGSQPRGFSLFILGSLVVHVAVTGLILLRSASARPRFDQPPIPVELVQLGKPRDPKLLPRKVKPAPPAPQAPKAPAADPEAVPVPTPESKKKAPASDNPEPKLSAAARRMLSRSEADLDDALAKLEEPEGSPEGFADGTTTDPNAASDAYLASVKRALSQNYQLPATISAAERPFLRAKLLVRIRADGGVAGYDVLERHPNAQFMTALEKLLRSIQFPKPPQRRLSELQNEGIEVVFKP